MTVTRPAPEAPSATRLRPPRATPEHRAPGRRAGRTGDLRRGYRLLRRFRGRRRPFVLGALLLIVEALAAVVEPIPIAYVIDYLHGARPALPDLGWPSVADSPRASTIAVLVVAIIVVAVVNSAADSLAEVCLARGGRVLGYNLRVAMYSHLQRLSLAYHDKRRTGDVITRVTGDVLVVEDFVVKSVSNLLGSFMVLLGTFGVLLWTSWRVALVALVIVPLLAVVSNYFSRRIKQVARRQRESEGDLASTTQEMLTSVRLVQSYGRGSLDLARFSEQTDRSMRAAVGVATVQAKFSFVIALLEAGAISTIVWIGVLLVDSSAITVGTLVFFILVMQNMFKPSRKIVSEWYQVGKVVASVDRILDLLERRPAVVDAPDAVPAPPVTGRLGLRRVTFGYEHEGGLATRPVLRDLSFEVSPGEVVALVGRSGAGKSTIAQLIPRLYDPDSGSVLVDGVDVRRYTLESLRAQVSLVLQDTVLLSGSVAANIGYGVEGATDEQIREAAHRANAHEFIEGLPKGYATVLGERGATLSGGQRQRIAIARAFIRRAPVLVLDEPTTGLDAESSRLVVGALSTLLEGATTIIVSHDRDLVRCADRVLLIENGRVVEEGTHGELLRAGGSYAELMQEGEPEQDAAPGRRLPRQLGGGSRPPVDAVAPPRPPRARLLEGVSGGTPHLAGALDPQRAAARAVAWAADAARGASVDDVQVGSVLCRPDGGATLRYAVRLSGARQGERTLLVEVPASGGRPVLRPFPHDPALPTLPWAVDPERMAAVLGKEVPGTGGVRGVGRARVTVVHHPRQGPCVLRYAMSGGPAGPAERRYPVVYGKVYPRDGARAATDGLRLLRGGVPPLPDGRTLVVPRPLAVVRSMRLAIAEEVPGSPDLPLLLRAVLDGGAEPGDPRRDALVEAVRTAGHVAGVIHRCPLPDGMRLATRSLAEVRAAAEAELLSVGVAWPDVAQELRGGAGAALDAAEADGSPAPACVLAHGDLTPGQILLAPDGGVGLVDVDTLCRAEPALDLGRFLAYLHVAAVRRAGAGAWPLARELSAAFLAAYVEAGPPLDDRADLAARVGTYRALALARIGVSACWQLKDERLAAVVEVLDAGDEWTRSVGG